MTDKPEKPLSESRGASAKASVRSSAAAQPASRGLYSEGPFPLTTLIGQMPVIERDDFERLPDRLRGLAAIQDSRANEMQQALLLSLPEFAGRDAGFSRHWVKESPAVSACLAAADDLRHAAFLLEAFGNFEIQEADRNDSEDRTEAEGEAHND